MLEIEYKGGTSVLLTTKERQMIVDPNVEMHGLKMGNFKNAVQLATEKRFQSPHSDDLVQLEGPGEYEVGPFAIKGIAAQRHLDTGDDAKASTIYHIDVLDFRIGFVGNIDATLAEEQLEVIGVVDILVIPVGGSGYTLDAKSAAKLVRQIEPKLVIPVSYKEDGASYEVPQDSVDLFLAEFSSVEVQRESKLKLKSVSSIPQSMGICLLARI